MPRSRPARPRARRLWILVVGVVVLLGGTGAAVWKVEGASTAATTTERTSQVTQQTIKDTVGTTGTVQPKQRADLSFTASGTVTRVYVDVGDQVSKGDELARIDDDDLQADLDAAHADYDAAVDDETTAQDDADTTAAQLDAARSKVAVQKSKLAQAKSALADATLRATISGTVAAVAVAKGDTVGSTSGTGSGSSTNGAGASTSSAQVTVISTGSFTVDASVGSADLAKMKKGLQAQITPTGATEPIYGTVASVAVMADSSTTTTTSGSSATFAVTVDITGEQKSLYAGASATVSIIVRQRADVLTVATAAISTADGKTVVTKLVDGAKTRTEISIGESYGQTTEVTRGLAAGDQVVVTSANRVPGGTQSQRSGSEQQGTGQQGTGAGGFPGGGEPPAGAPQPGGTR